MNKKEVIKQLILREPRFNLNKLHPKAKLKRAQYTQTPEPLKYKLQDTSKLTPFDMFKPLKPKEGLPFQIHRSYNGNLPIYRKYYQAKEFPDTIIRHIEGDIPEFTKELSKIVSNAPIKIKMGKIIIQGSHRESVTKWLLGLGF